MLIGTFAAISMIVFRDEHSLLLHWKNAEGWQNNAIDWPAVEMFYIWIFFQITALPLVGGCIEAIRKGYTSLGIHSMFATFVYYFALILGFMWKAIRNYPWQ